MTTNAVIATMPASSSGDKCQDVDEARWMFVMLTCVTGNERAQLNS